MEDILAEREEIISSSYKIYRMEMNEDEAQKRMW